MYINYRRPPLLVRYWSAVLAGTVVTLAVASYFTGRALSPGGLLGVLVWLALALVSYLLLLALGVFMQLQADRWARSHPLYYLILARRVFATVDRDGADMP